MSKRSKSFKSTPIPHRSKSGEPMQYFVVADDGGQHIKVTRAECLTPAAKSDSPFPQRWFVDEESGLVVRLPRTAEGDRIARDNMRDIWREQKRTKRNIECVGQGTNRCPITCGNCPARENCDSAHKETGGINCAAKCDSCSLKQSRVVEMDMLSDRDDEEPCFQHADPFDFESVQEEVALLDTLHAALADLTQEDRDLIEAIFWGGKTERQLAPELGLKESKSVNKRKHRILELLRNNEALRSFFE